MCLPEPKSIHLTNDPIESNEKSKQGHGTWLSNVSLKTVNCVVMHLKFD